MSYGVATDPWSFADTKNQIQSSSEEPSVGGEAQCLDSNGDVSASTVYDTANKTVSATYQRCGTGNIVFYDTASGSDFRLGKVIGGNVITSIEVGTSNTERPTITISGEFAHGVADTTMEKYDPSDLEISGDRKATAIGATADTNTKVTGSSATASVSVAKVADSQGATACMNVYGGRVEATTDLVGCAGAPGASKDTGWEKSAGTSGNEENTAYETGAITVFKNLTKM